LLLAGLHTQGTSIFIEPVLSRDHTERMLKACGVEIEQNGSEIKITGPSKLAAQNWVVPSDFSSAAFFIVAGVIVPNSKITLSQINLNPTRTGLLDVLTSAGILFQIENEKVIGGEPIGDLTVQSVQKIKPFHIDKTVSPRLIDEIPILAVLATQAHGRTVMEGLDELRVKETDRLMAISKNLLKMGANVKETADGLIIEGPTVLKGANLDSFDDHRIAMSFAIAGLIAQEETKINDSECVSISFPGFWDVLERLTR
jgi:3-phosphoshikimate 1-carboxyvinyltransferase